MGQVGVARARSRPAGQVAVQGELWNAVADGPVEDGAPVRVVDVKGLTLKVVKNGSGGRNP